MVFAACASASPRPAQAGGGYRRPWSDDDVAKPAWIANPTRDGTVIAAWGSTSPDPQATRSTLRDRALDAARRELARMVMVKVQAVLKDYVAVSDAGTVSFTQSVSQTIAMQSVRASYQRDEWTHPKTGELFIWAVADAAFAERLAQHVAGAARAEASDDPRLDAQLRAKTESDKGFAELDRLLDRTFSESVR